MDGVIDRQQWDTFLKEFNHRNALCASRFQILGDDIGVQEEVEHLPLSGLSLEEKDNGATRVAAPQDLATDLTMLRGFIGSMISDTIELNLN